MFRIVLAVLFLAAVASAEDSPLVALTKHSNRTASKTPVITNETVASSKGRISFTAGEAPSVQAAPSHVAAPAVLTTAPTTTAPPAARAYTPVTAPAADYNPPTTVRNIEPQSSATRTEPQSTARTIEPSSGARSVEPQSTARTIESQAVAKPPQ